MPTRREPGLRVRWLCAALWVASCTAAGKEMTSPIASAGSAGFAPAGGGAGVAGAFGSGGAPGGAAAPDPCPRAIEQTGMGMASLGQLATCVPAGIPLTCRADSPEYACSESPSTDTSSLNRCRNTSDCAVLQAANKRADTMMGESVSNIVRSCGLPYLTRSVCAEIESLTAECIAMQTGEISAPGLSAECSQCFTQTLLCNLKCLAHCSLDAESPPCVACMHVEGCRGLFYQCSGLEPVD